jgi:hypothetical protein
VTDEELKAIEARQRTAHFSSERVQCIDVDLPALVAEVRRLRGVIALVQDRNEYLRSHGRDGCPWCGGDVNNDHDDGSRTGYPCPAFMPDGAVR